MEAIADVMNSAVRLLKQEQKDKLKQEKDNAMKAQPSAVRIVCRHCGKTSSVDMCGPFVRNKAVRASNKAMKAMKAMKAAKAMKAMKAITPRESESDTTVSSANSDDS